MLNKVWVKSLLVMLIMVFWGIAAPGFADWGMGYGPYPRWGHHRMHAWNHGAEQGPGCGYWGDLSKEDIEKLEKERTDFFETTKSLRAKIYQKRLELRSELAKENPDAKKAAELQTEISKMKAEFDQKRLNHFLNMRKINPDMGRGFGRGYGMMRHGWMQRSMIGPWEMRPRGYGGRYCPNEPYGGFRGD
jgi:Spy/CpxP family protein refolding chaperone